MMHISMAVRDVVLFYYEKYLKFYSRKILFYKSTMLFLDEYLVQKYLVFLVQSDGCLVLQKLEDETFSISRWNQSEA